MDRVDDGGAEDPNRSETQIEKALIQFLLENHRQSKTAQHFISILARPRGVYFSDTVDEQDPGYLSHNSCVSRASPFGCVWTDNRRRVSYAEITFERRGIEKPVNPTGLCLAHLLSGAIHKGGSAPESSPETPKAGR